LLIAVLTMLPQGSQALIYRRPPFVYRYAGNDTSVVMQLDRKLRERLPAIEDALGVELKHTVRIDLTLSREQFYRLTRGRVPNWAGGVAFPREWRVIVKAPVFFGRGVPLEVLTAHEITHILLHQVVADEYLPRWFEEGVCITLSGEQRSGSLRLVFRAVLADRLIPLPRVDDVLRFSAQDAELAYAEAGIAVRLMVDYFSWYNIRRMLAKIRDGTDFEDAFEAATGYNYEDWQIEWFSYMRRKFRWGFLFDIDYIIWMLILLLAAAAVVITFIRKKMQLKRWREEESEDYRDDVESIHP